MGTEKPRIYTVFEMKTFQSVKRLAKRDHTSLSHKVEELVEKALEQIEDLHWEEVYEHRKRRGGKWLSQPELERRLGITRSSRSNV